MNLSCSCFYLSVPNSCPASPRRHGELHHYAGYTTPLRTNLHANSVPNSNAITPPTPPSLASGALDTNPQRAAANGTPTNSIVQQSMVSKNNGISISPLGSAPQPQLEVQLPSDGSQQQMLQLPQFNSQFIPGNGATFVPLQNSIHPSGGAFDHLTLEEQKPDLNHLNNHSQNAIIYPSDDGIGSLWLILMGQNIASSYLKTEQKIPSATFFNKDFGRTCSILLSL